MGKHGRRFGSYAVAACVLVALGYQFESTGFPGKVLWDWLELLVVPGALVLAAQLFNRAEKEREEEAADEQAQDSNLQSYFDSMGKLMVEERLRDSDEDAEVRKVARARTLATLDTLGAKRKARLLRFLQESGLLQRGRPVVKLAEAYLNHADLRRSRLSGADLSRTVLIGADLRGASLRRSDLSRAVLSDAKLGDVPLTDGDQTREDPDFDAISHGTQPYVTPRGLFTSITYVGADLRGAVLRGAVLRDVDLRGALLNGADLTDAVLTGAHVTQEQLKTCGSLSGTTMPDGTKRGAR